MTDTMKSLKKIDAHSHIGYFGGWCNVGITPEELIEEMKTYNIEKSVISTFPPQASIDAVDQYPDQLIGAIWVNPVEGEAALNQIRDAVNNHGFKAIKIHPLIHSFRPTDDCAIAVARLAEELDIPLMIHSGHPPHSLPWAIAELADLFPKVKIVLIHMGHGNGIFIQSAIDMAKKYPNLYLETSGMPMHTKIAEAYHQVGRDKIMFGIDLPFHHPTVEIQKAVVSGLNEEELADFFYNNAKDLLNL